MFRATSVSIVAVAIWVVLVGGVAGAGGLPPGGSFVDDNESVFEGDIEWMAFEGLTTGCNPPVNDRFCPDDDVTRGQMAAFLVRGLELVDDGGGDLFVDDDASIFESDIDRLAAAGITRGCNPPVNDRFCPDDNVTRGQMAAFIRRALTRPLMITTTELPIAFVGEPYSIDLHSTGGVPPFEWHLDVGELPAGLSLSQGGTISGTPTTEETSTFSVVLLAGRGAYATVHLDLRVVGQGQIAFIHVVPVAPGRVNGSVCVVDPDGSNEHCITASDGHEHAVSWSLDRQRMAFTSYRGGRTDLYLMNADGSGITAVTNDSHTERDPAFSPDGTKIAFALGPYDATDIWVINSDGTGLLQLTHDGKGNQQPTWSPEGLQIAFTTARDYEDYDFDIYVMNADGSDERPLFRRDFQDQNADWSPDGSLITFDTHGYDDGHFCNSVYVVNSDGTDPQFVACGVQPSFSPDGNEIAYSTWYGLPPGSELENTDIFVVGVDGSDPRCVSCSIETGAEHPDWG